MSSRRGARSAIFGRIDKLLFGFILEVKTMPVEYIQGALEMAEYKKLDDGTWFA